ncbi:CvpA family protein [uncultured Polaribacter sp.]|uniref:CvpA family protein n=1 Tax=uncultured Polaribacter sp. TaxID=174711 RepID=UPI00260E6FC4|nr:CvpA family protein [uncultured Polaribacter sp.]
MNIFDIVILVLLILSFVRGIMKGLFAEVASLVAVIIGIYAAINYSFYIENYLVGTSFNWSSQTNKIVSFAVTFLVVVILIIIIGKILTKIADVAALGLINKFLGGLFGALKTALILSVVFIFFGRINNTIPFISQETLDESLFYKPIKQIAPTLFPSIIKEGEDGKTTIELPNKKRGL